MALIIEDGTGVAAADSYATVAEAEAFDIAFYGAAQAGTTVAKEAALRTAAAFMNTLPWLGHRTNGRDQGLAYPRADVVDPEENEIADNEIPREVKNAQIIFARAELASPGFLSPVVTLTQSKVLIEVKGIRFQPLSSPNTVEAARPVVTQALDLVQPFLQQGNITYLERA